VILAIDTSTMLCRIALVDGDRHIDEEWEAGRQLADQLIGHLREFLAAHDASWSDISSLIIFKGPGSFTGLRIGLTVMNTMAETLDVPIVGVTGENWVNEGRRRLESGENDRLVMPLYGREANITKPRK
jgi:tRNA threonylcarbamoyladenosine biosynthesis protein TsaB